MGFHTPILCPRIHSLHTLGWDHVLVLNYSGIIGCSASLVVKICQKDAGSWDSWTCFLLSFRLDCVLDTFSILDKNAFSVYFEDQILYFLIHVCCCRVIQRLYISCVCYIIVTKVVWFVSFLFIRMYLPCFIFLLWMSETKDFFLLVKE